MIIKLGWLSCLVMFTLSIPSYAVSIPSYIWISPSEIAKLPSKGPAWENLKKHADHWLPKPNLSDQDDKTNVLVMAKALVFVKTGRQIYRQAVIRACMNAINTENDGTTLAFGRELMAYVIAAQLVKIPPQQDKRFKQWLRQSLNKRLGERTLRSTHQDRPNNWGLHAGASRAAVAIYLNDLNELKRTANVFRAWLGESHYHPYFKFRKIKQWQANSKKPVGINPPGAMKQGHNIDGVLPDEQRRSGDFKWPPAKEGYVWEGLQGAVAIAVVLKRAGFTPFQWSDKALLRAFNWLHNEAKFPAQGDDTWQPHLINHYYGSNFPAPIPSRAGKNIGWTDWTHGTRAISPDSKPSTLKISP
jgi:hypothetical protein